MGNSNRGCPFLKQTEIQIGSYKGETLWDYLVKAKRARKEYMNRLDVPLCLKEDFELIIDDVFTIMGVGTVATGNISTGMCREGENACVYKTNGGVLETIITTIDIHTKERKSNGCGYKTEHVGLGLRGVSKEQLEKGDRVIVKNANMYGM